MTSISLTECFISSGRLWGKAQGHPDPQFKDGELIYTSPLVGRVTGTNDVKTKNSRYTVVSFDAEQSAKTTDRFNALTEVDEEGQKITKDDTSIDFAPERELDDVSDDHVTPPVSEAAHESGAPFALAPE